MRSAVLALLALAHVAPAAPLAVAVQDHQLTLTAGERVYTVDDKAMVQPLGLLIHVVGQDLAGKSIWLEQKTFRGFRLLRDDAALKVAGGTWELTEGTPHYRVELEFEVREGSPGLTVRTRVRRLSAGSGSCYSYWGFGLPVTHYLTPGTAAKEFSRTEWDLRPRARWMFVSQKKSGDGFGLMTDGRLGRAPATGDGQAAGEVGGSPYVVCVPRFTTLGQDQAQELTFTVWPTRSADEVAAVYRLLGALGADRVLFDAQSFARQPLTVATRPAVAETLATGDGLALGLAPDGQVAELSVGGQSLWPAQDRPLTGVCLRDHTAHSPVTAAGGTVRRVGDGLVQTGRALDVEVTTTFQARADRIDIHGELLDTTGRDRAISVYFALPVDRTRSWRWDDDLERSRVVLPDEEYLAAAGEVGLDAGANGLNSLLPFAALSGPVGLGLSVPLDQPRLCRLAYNAETQQYYVAFDLALTPATTRFPSRADFSLSLFTCDPAWGLRSCAAKYYAMFPQFFEKRVKRDGGWVCWGTAADVKDLPGLGYAYHWGVAGPAGCKFANDHGLYALPYVEATNLHQTMEEFASATSEEVVKRLQWIADPARKEALPAWKYDHPYQPYLGDRDAALRRTAAAYLKSLIYDREGHIYGQASKTEFDLLIAKYIPCNANPFLPGGIGEYFLDVWLPKTQQFMESAGATVDGIAMDNYHTGGNALGRRREQFAFETIPLTFEKTTGEPVLLKEFTTYEFTAELARRLRPQGKFIIANAVGPTFPFTYHLLDIHGYEWGIDTTAAFARTIAYHKPVVSLPVQPPHQAEQWVKAHLRYGVMPGGYANSESFLNREAMVKYSPLCRALQVAGWEPVTLATSNQPELQVERFGAETDGLLFLTVYNHAAAGRPGELRLDLARLHVAPDASVTELVSGRAGRLAAGVLAVDVAAHDVQVWRIGR